MKSSAFADLLAGFDSITGDESVKQQFRDLVARVSTAHGIGMQMLEREGQILFAQRLLDQHVSRATIRDRLRARYGVSRSGAYRVICAALNCPKTEP